MTNTTHVFGQLGAALFAGLALSVASPVGLLGVGEQAAPPAPAVGPQQPAGAPAPGGAGTAGGPGGPQGGRRGGGAGRNMAPPPADDLAGFTQIFNGTSLAGWDGDPRIWRAENGALVGQTTPDAQITDNTFIVWRGGTLKDFELKLEARIAEGNGNSGIQVRSKMMTEATTRSGGQARPWGMGGYQVEVSGPNSSAATGTLLEEGAGMRGFLSQHGQVLRRLPNREQKLMGTLGENLTAVINAPPAWNSFHIIGRGPQLTVLINGRVTSIVIDEDTQLRALEGLLGLQMHVGQPFRMEFKNIYLRGL